MSSKAKILILSLISLVMTVSLTGCSSLVSTRMPSGGESMAQVYNQAINGSSEGGSSMTQLRKKVSPLTRKAVNYTPYTVTQKNAIENLFPTLPNPSLVMYVYPHLIGSGVTQVPVPGYSTVFSLYKNVNYKIT